jgi:hypothetical protein
MGKRYLYAQEALQRVQVIFAAPARIKRIKTGKLLREGHQNL